MTEEYINAGFRCDKPGIRKLMYNLEEEAFENKQLLNIEIEEKDQYAGIDVHFTAYTWDGQVVAKYSMECKERPDTGHTDKPDWVIETKKVNDLRNDEKNGYIPRYAYIWKDGYYAIWDINTWDLSEPRPFYKKKHTMGERAKYEKKTLHYNPFVTISSSIKQGYLN